MKKMNICYCLDEGSKDYSRYLGVSILSLLENNKDENINIYILSEYIEESNKKELIRIVESYGKKIFFSKGKIVPEKFKKILSVNPLRHFSVFYRFFFLNCFDIKDRLLYLDCDTIINKNLSEFYNSDFEGNTFIGSLEGFVNLYNRLKKYGLSVYINAGVFLLNIEEYKKVDMYEEIKKVNKKYGIPDYNDQDYINIIFKNKIKIYKYLQLICSYKRIIDFKNYLILHTTRKPNMGGFSLCSPKIENIFNKYLEKTKRKSYISYKKKGTIKLYLQYIYDSICSFLVHFVFVCFGEKYAGLVGGTFSMIAHTIGKFLRKIGIIK